MTVVEGEKRTYPFGRLASHVFGQLSEITAAELKEPRFQGYEPSWVIGQNGVEGTYDNWLRGQDGSKRVTIDATGTPLSDQVVRAARSGYRLRLTIDKNVQAELEKALADGVKRAAPNGADSGAMIAMDPKTGAIRGIASYPNFDPNWFVTPNLKANRGHLRYLATSKTTPQLNRAITGLYPAASTFKPFTAIAAVESGVLPNIYDTIRCSGKVRIAGHTFNNWDPYANMLMSLPTALAQSCDTYFYELGYRIYKLDKKQGSPLQHWAGQFGFGKPTGIDIAGESKGILPTLAYRQKTFKTLVDQQWRPGDSVLLGIGQGALEVTPLQIAVGYAAIANGGYVVTPTSARTSRTPRTARASCATSRTTSRAARSRSSLDYSQPFARVSSKPLTVSSAPRRRCSRTSQSKSRGRPARQRRRTNQTRPSSRATHPPRTPSSWSSC